MKVAYRLIIESYSFYCEGRACNFGDYATCEGEFLYSGIESESAYISADVVVAGVSEPLLITKKSIYAIILHLLRVELVRQMMGCMMSL